MSEQVDSAEKEKYAFRLKLVAVIASAVSSVAVYFIKPKEKADCQVQTMQMVEKIITIQNDRANYLEHRDDRMEALKAHDQAMTDSLQKIKSQVQYQILPKAKALNKKNESKL